MRVADIIAAVAAESGVPPAEVAAKRRGGRRNVPARAVCLIARTETGRSYPQIGAALGRRHRSSVESLAMAAERQFDRDPAFRDLCRRAVQRLRDAAQ